MSVYEIAVAVVSLLAGMVAVAKAMVTSQARAMDRILSQRAAAEIADRKLVADLVGKLTENHMQHMGDISQTLRELKEGMAAERQMLELMAQRILVYRNGDQTRPVRRRPERKTGA